MGAGCLGGWHVDSEGDAPAAATEGATSSKGCEVLATVVVGGGCGGRTVGRRVGALASLGFATGGDWVAVPWPGAFKAGAKASDKM